MTKNARDENCWQRMVLRGGDGSRQAGGRRIVFTSPNWLSRSHTFAGSMLHWVLLHI